MSVLLYNNKYDYQKYPAEHNDFVEYSMKIENKGIALVPTSKLIRRLKNRYIQSSSSPVPDINIFNIEKFVNLMFSHFFDIKKYELISDAYKRILFEEASELVEFELYSRNGKISPPILEKLEKVIAGMKQKGIMPEDMTKESGELFDNIRFRDVNNLYAKYQELLGDYLLDYPEKIFRLTEYFINDENKENINSFFAEFDFILLSGFSQFTIPEARLFGILSKFNIPFALNVDLDKENDPVFGNLQEVITEVNVFSEYTLKSKQLIEDNVTDIKPKNYNTSPASVALRKWLFHTDVNINNQNLKQVLNVFQADDIDDEVQSITKLVKYLILKKGYQPYEICVTARQPEKYSEMFRMSFASSGIPANISDRFALDSSIVVTAIIDALNILNKGFKTADVFKFIQNPMVHIDSEINANNLMKVTSELRFYGGWTKGGIGGWIRIMKNTYDYLNKISNEAGSDEIDNYMINSRIKEYKKALEDISVINDKFDFEMNKEISIKEFEQFINTGIIEKFEIKSCILELLEQIKVSDNSEEHLYMMKIEELEKNSRALSEFSKLLSELVYIHTKRYPDRKYSQEELTQKLTTAVQASKYNINEKLDYGVEITSIEQTRGIPYKVMILCGAVDGSFPIPYQTDTYLGMELKDSENKHKREEQIQFYQFLTNNIQEMDNSEQKLYIFYPSFDNEKELVRSHFIDSVLRIASADDDMEEIVKVTDKLRKEPSTKPDWLDAVTTLDELYYHSDYYTGNKYRKQTEDLKSVNTDFKKIHLSLNDKLYIEKEKLDDAQKNHLQNYHSHIYSISELETYAGCPYKYFAERILKFRQKEDFEKGLSPLESGSALHNILYRFFTELYNEESDVEIKYFGNYKGIKLLEHNEEKYKEKLRNIANHEYLSKNISTVAFNAEKYNITKKGGILDIWLEHELEFNGKNSDYFAAFFETPFAEGNKEITIGKDLKIRGKIDRIDLRESNGTLLFRVTDYKRTTGSVKKDIHIEKGESFQMPVYIEAGKTLLSGFDGNTDYASAAYYPIYIRQNSKPELVLDKHNDKLQSKPKPEEYYDDVINFVLDEINFIRKDITEGKFSVEPKKDVCKYCSFISVCKIKEKKIK